MILVFVLLFDAVSLSKMVFADCLKSGEQCCTGYVWNENLRKCERCKSGFTGPSCKKKCPYPSYGLECQMICSCTQTFCNSQYGCIRSECNEGMYGPLCSNKCPYPSYGKGCQRICSCNNETCDHKHGCFDATDAKTSSTTDRHFKKVTPTARTQPETNVLSEEAAHYMYMHSTGMKKNEILSSTFTVAQLEINPDKKNIHNIGSIVFPRNNNNMKEKTTISGANSILILTISLNTFAILFVCCIFVLCLFCKRKWIFRKIFENGEKGTLNHKHRLYAKGHVFKDHKQRDVDLEMTEMTMTVGNFRNEESVSRLLARERYYPSYIYENDISPSLATPMTESELENHQYLTVV